MDRTYQMKQLRNKGLSYGSIGDLFGLSRQRVHQLISGYILPNRNKEYDRIKHFIFERDNFTCQICREKGMLIHHIDKNNLNNNPNNLVCLCSKCHLYLHKPKEVLKETKLKTSNTLKGYKASEVAKKNMSKAAKLATKLRRRNKKGQFTWF